MKEDYARPGIRAKYFIQYIARFLFRENSAETPPDGRLQGVSFKMIFLKWLQFELKK